MTRSYYDARPSKFEAVGNGSYIYRWDIQEEDAPQQIMAEGEDQPAGLQAAIMQLVRMGESLQLKTFVKNHH